MRRSTLLVVAPLLALVAGLGAYLLSRPATWQVSSAVVIAAPYPLVMEQLSDLRRWSAWSPLAAAGEGAEWRLGGPGGGVGQSGYRRDERSGATRRLTVVEASPTRVAVEVEEDGPTPGLRDLAFQAEPAGEVTRLLATVSGENDLWRRLRALVAEPDQAARRELTETLARLRPVAEAEGRVPRFRLVRSLRVAAPAARLLALLTDTHRLPGFSPWEPAGEVARSFGGAERGVGASYYWSTAGAAGSGRATITGVDPGRVELELAIGGPGALESDLEFRLAPEGEATRVTFIAHGEQRDARGLAAAAGAVSPPSGRDLELGLARLKALAEAEPLPRGG